MRSSPDSISASSMPSIPDAGRTQDSVAAQPRKSATQAATTRCGSRSFSARSAADAEAIARSASSTSRSVAANLPAARSYERPCSAECAMRRTYRRCSVTPARNMTPGTREKVRIVGRGIQDGIFVAREDRAVNVGLAAEVTVDEGVGDAGTLRDRAHGRCGEAAGREQVFRRVEDGHGGALASASAPLSFPRQSLRRRSCRCGCYDVIVDNRTASPASPRSSKLFGG